MLMLSGCSKLSFSDITPELNSFCCEFTIVDSELSGELKVAENNDLSFTLFSPDIIYGTSLHVTESSLTIEAEGLKKSFDRDNAPDFSAPIYIYEALISSAGRRINSENDSLFIDGTCECGDYRLFLGTTGYPEKIIMSGINETALFSSVITD